jgi:hypothetical protein
MSPRIHQSVFHRCQHGSGCGHHAGLFTRGQGSKTMLQQLYVPPPRGWRRPRRFRQCGALWPSWLGSSCRKRRPAAAVPPRPKAPPWWAVDPHSATPLPATGSMTPIMKWIQYGGEWHTATGASTPRTREGAQRSTFRTPPQPAHNPLPQPAQRARVGRKARTLSAAPTNPTARLWQPSHVGMALPQANSRH